MYQQYLSQEAITRVPLEESIISKFLSRIESEEPCDYWFEQVQEKVGCQIQSSISFRLPSPP
ncbi:hypothetical protein COOONC_17446 [Cooperia oncophora]